MYYKYNIKQVYCLNNGQHDILAPVLFRLFSVCACDAQRPWHLTY